MGRERGCALPPSALFLTDARILVLTDVIATLLSTHSTITFRVSVTEQTLHGPICQTSDSLKIFWRVSRCFRNTFVYCNR